MKQVSEPDSSESRSNASGDIREGDPKACPTRLIDDTPAEDDLLAFHGDIGPHKRVAQAIAEIIRTPDEAGGKMIGLEGGWGAGKTTVINLLRKQLASNEEISVFSFDAWAHEGDPLRRTYLESLIRHFQSIQPIRWVDKTEWDKTLEKLASRRRVTNTRTVPKTTTLGKLFAISAFLVPLGSQFLATSLRQPITLDPAGPIAWMFIIGLLFTTAPFSVLGGNLIRVWIKRWRKAEGREAQTEQRNGNEAEVSEWAFLVGNAITETKQETTEIPEPTSIEFEDDFRRLMRTALPESSNRQAVIVLDNLDRVDPKDALSIWATLQTFLQNQSTQKEQWLNKLWIVVPYDPSGLRRLWENRGARNENESEETAAQSRETEEPEHVVSDSFMDKSFQLRFEVSPPILSNWKAYLTKLVEQALPEHDVEDQHTIYRVFDLCRAKEGVAPTPREVKLYVNQIGVIHRQWQHEFPIGHIAYYVILCRSHENIRRGLCMRKLPDRNIEVVLPPKLGENLAGLVFNVRANHGQQLLLGNPINDALAKNDSESLRELEKLHGDGFWAVLEEVATSRIAGSDAKTVANAALCLDQSEVLKDHHRSEAKTVIQALARAASDVKSWAPLDKSLANGIATACRLVSVLDVSKTIVASVRQTIEEKAKETADEKVVHPIAEETIEGLVTICKELDSLGQQDALRTPFTLPVNAEGWVDVCSHLGKQEPQWWLLFKPHTKFEEISQLFCMAVTKGQFSEPHLAAVEVTEASPIRHNWDTLAAAFEQRLNASQNPNSNEANSLLHGLSMLRRYKCEQAQAASKRLAEGGHLMHHLHQAKLVVWVQARCIVTFLEQRPGAVKPQSVGNSEAGYTTLTTLLNTDDADLAKHMVEILQAEARLHLLFNVVDERKKLDPLVVRCLRIVADSETSEILYTPAAVCERWRELKQHLVEDEGVDRFDKLISHLCNKTSLVEHVQTAEGGFKHEDAGLYLAICRAPSSVSFQEWCRDGLETLNATTWKAELENEGDVLDLMLALADVGISSTLKQPYQDALVEHAKGVLAGSVNPSDDLISRRSIVLAALETGSAKKILSRRLLQAAMDRDGKCADRFFEMYGEEIADHETLAGSDNIVAELFSPLVRERAIGGVRWLERLLSNNPNLLDKYTDTASVQDFRERIQVDLAKSADEGDEVHVLITKIANTLGIERKVEPPRDEAVSDHDKSGDEGSEERKSSK